MVLLSIGTLEDWFHYRDHAASSNAVEKKMKDFEDLAVALAPYISPESRQQIVDQDERWATVLMVAKGQERASQFLVFSAAGTLVVCLLLLAFINLFPYGTSVTFFVLVLLSVLATVVGWIAWRDEGILRKTFIFGLHGGLLSLAIISVWSGIKWSELSKEYAAAVAQTDAV
jgi:hypothetical protein